MSTSIFIGNLVWDATASDLHFLFAPFGTVARATVISDRETGRSRGFGFVEMPNAQDAQKAIHALDGKPFRGRPLVVNLARPREDRIPSRYDY